jgi:hypothetical protein
MPVGAGSVIIHRIASAIWKIVTWSSYASRLSELTARVWAIGNDGAADGHSEHLAHFCRIRRLCLTVRWDRLGSISIEDRGETNVPTSADAGALDPVDHFISVASVTGLPDLLYPRLLSKLLRCRDFPPLVL